MLYNKANNAKSIIEGAIDVYDSAIIGVMLVPTINGTKELYMNKTQTGIDLLAKSAQANGMEADTILASLVRYRYLIDIYENSTVTEASPETKTVEGMINAISKRLSDISETAIKTDDEYLIYKTKDYLKFKIPTAESLTNFISIVTLIKYGIVGGGLGALYVIVPILFSMTGLAKKRRERRSLGRNITGWEE